MPTTYRLRLVWERHDVVLKTGVPMGNRGAGPGLWRFATKLGEFPGFRAQVAGLDLVEV
jgi:hypothetical protein